MDAEVFQRGKVAGEGLEFVESVRIFKSECAGVGAAQAGQMRAAAERLAQLVGNGADVAAGADAHGEFGFGSGEREDLERVDGDGGGLEFDGFALAGELVCGSAGDFFGGERGRHLLELALEAGGGAADLVEAQMRCSLRDGLRA